jgi:hypothetical protein
MGSLVTKMLCLRPGSVRAETFIWSARSRLVEDKLCYLKVAFLELRLVLVTRH